MTTAKAATSAAFVEPMLLLSTRALPEGAEWLYELKLDGYRALAIRDGRTVRLRSRNDNDFNDRYPHIAAALKSIPAHTVIDGEIVAFDRTGRPSFNALQNRASNSAPVFYYVFDVLVLAGRSLMNEPLDTRRELLKAKVLPRVREPIRFSDELQGPLANLLTAVRSYGFEGLVAKRRYSVYEPGARSGAWQKLRVNKGQEFVIGGYTVGATTFDALAFGYYEGDLLMYAGRTRNGFTPGLRRELFAKLRKLQTATCPFVNLPEKKSGRWGRPPRWLSAGGSSRSSWASSNS